MHLAEFIAAALAEVVAGIREGRLRCGDSLVAPDLLVGEVPGWHRVLVGDLIYYVQNVEFDVAVTVSRDESGKASLGVAWLGLGADVSTSRENATISRVKFKIPLALPPEAKVPIENPPGGK